MLTQDYEGGGENGRGVCTRRTDCQTSKSRANNLAQTRHQSNQAKRSRLIRGICYFAQIGFHYSYVAVQQPRERTSNYCHRIVHAQTEG